MADGRAPQVALELGDELEVAFDIFVRCIRREEIARVRQAVGADRPQVRQPQQAAEVLAHVTARGAVRQDRKSTRLNSSHVKISYAVFCLKKKIRSTEG